MRDPATPGPPAGGPSAPPVRGPATPGGPVGAEPPQRTRGPATPGDPIVVEPTRGQVPWQPWPIPTPNVPSPGATAQPSSENRTEPGLAVGGFVPIVYGRCFVAPDVFYGWAYGWNANDVQLRLALAFSEGEIDAYESWAIDQTHIISASDEVLYFETLEEKTGTLIQTAASGGYYGATFGAAHGTLPGLAYVYTELVNNQAFIPKAIVRGRKMYDPRLGSWPSGDEPPGAYCAYSANPALIMADLLTSVRYGAAVPTELVDWTSVGTAADYCDFVMPTGEKRAECHIVVRDRASLGAWFDTIGIHFGGAWRQREGLFYLDVHKDMTGTPVISIGESDFVTSPRLSRQGGAGSSDEPNRVTVEWIDPASDWTERSMSVGGADVEAGATVREGSTYKIHGCQNEQQAARTAWYLLNAMAATLTLEADLLPAFLHLRVGDLISVTDSTTGLVATTFTVTDVAPFEDESGVRIKATEYNAAIWSLSPYTSGALPGGSPTALAVAHDVRRVVVTAASDGSSVAWWEEPVVRVDSVHASGWSLTGAETTDPVPNAALLNDGSTSTAACRFNTAAVKTRLITLDCTATKTFRGVRITAAERNVFFTLSPQYSNDGVAWTNVSSLVSPSSQAKDTSALWVQEAVWADGGAHRYWQIVVTPNGIGVGDWRPREIQFWEDSGDVYTIVKIYRLHAGNSVSDPIIAEVAPENRPTASTPLNIEALWRRGDSPYNDPEIPTLWGRMLDTLDICVSVQSKLGQISVGRGAKSVRDPFTVGGAASSAGRFRSAIVACTALPSVSAAGQGRMEFYANKYQASENGGAFSPLLTQAGATPGVLLQATSPGSAQTGHANITGTAKVGAIGRSGGSASWVPPSAEGAAGQAFTTDGAGGMAFASLGDSPVLLRVTRTLAAAVGSWVEIGSFAAAQGAASLLIQTIADTVGVSVAKSFAANTVYYAGIGSYYAATPFGNRSLVTNDYEVDVATSYAVSTLRLRRIASDGATAVSIAVLVTGTIGAAGTVVSLSGSGSGATIAGCHNAGVDVQPGAVTMWATASAPAGWLFCDGSAVSRTSYARLFSVISTTFGSGDGSTTFNVPDLRQRFPLGKAASGTGSTLGGTGGGIDHVHTVDPGAVASAAGSYSGANVLAAGADYQRSHTHSVDVPSTTSSSNNPPFLAVNFIIRF